jgi:hypothetical protein
MMMTKKRSLLVCASVVLSLVSPSVGGFWDNNKVDEPEDHTVKLSHDGAASSNTPVEYGVDVVSLPCGIRARVEGANTC